MKKLILSMCFSFVAVAVFAQDNEQLNDSILVTDLDEVEVMGGIIDLAKDRVTPIAVSTITASDIEKKGGYFDLIETMRSTPSITVNRGGGFGDGNMFLRGFEQTNIAFMINGQPVNAVEDGKVYWSNWSGLMDVAEEVEIQRGLGASKLAVSSVGGTVNIITKTVDQQAGGFYKSMAGSNSYFRNSAYLSTGLNDNGWAFSMLLGHWSGDGNHWFSQGQGQTYYFSIGYKPNDNHIFNMFITGAPQWHGAGGQDSLGAYIEYGRDFSDGGGYLDGEKIPWGRNFYHKPLYNISWDWNINDNSSLSTVVYGSHGRGGFAYPEGDFYGAANSTAGEDMDFNYLDYDAVVAQNTDPSYSDRGGIIKASINSHNWYGFVTNYNTDLSDNLTLNVGLDGRLYNGIHFRTPVNFLGLSSYRDATKSVSYNPWEVFGDIETGDRSDYAISYDYEEIINYIGGFAQLEYEGDSSSLYVSTNVSSQSHQKEDFMFNLGKAEKVTNQGFNVKLGGSIDLSSSSSVYANFGFYDRQPYHSNLFSNERYSNDLSPDVVNEEITGFELGYTYESSNFKAIVDFYTTTWDNRILTSSSFEDGQLQSFSKTSPISQVHSGVEAQLMYRPTSNFMLRAYASVGDWVYNSNVTSTTFNESGAEISQGGTLYLKDVKVGSAAQTTGGFELTHVISDVSTFDISLNHYADLYGYADFEDGVGGLPGVFSTSDNNGTPKLPNYTLVDASLNYRIPVGDNSLQARLSVYNLFDEFYIEQMFDADPMTPSAYSYKGVNVENSVDIGYGRTYTLGLTYRF